MDKNLGRSDSDSTHGHETDPPDDGENADRPFGAREEPVGADGEADASPAPGHENTGEASAETEAEQSRQEPSASAGNGPWQPQQYPRPGPQYGAPPHGPWPQQYQGAPPHPFSPYPPPPPRPPRPKQPLPSAPAWLPAAVLAAGTSAALFLPAGYGPGLGTLAAGTVAALAVVSVVRGAWSPWALCYGTLAGVLLSTVAVRAANWVVLTSLVGAFALASLAAAVRAPGARTTWSGMLYGAFALVRNLPATPRFLAAAPTPGGSRKGWQPMLVSVSVTVLLLVVFGWLFMAADPVFAGIISTYLEGLPFRAVMFVLFALGSGAAALTALRPVRARRSEQDTTEKAEPRSAMSAVVWTLPLGALNLLFLAFIGVQTAALFGGEEYVMDTADLTYAEYARQGFFQLLTVGFLALGVIAVTCRLLRSGGTGERRLRNVLLGMLCLLTLLLLASALNRLGLYSETFGLTRSRVMAEAAIWWIGAVFVLVVIAGVVDTFGGRTGWLPRTAVALTGVGLALLAYSDPDLRIAESHLDMPPAEIDMRYLNGLSDDAVPALTQIVRQADCPYITESDRALIRERVDEDIPWTAWNASRQRADALLEEMLDDSAILTTPVGCGGSTALEYSPYFSLYR